jgi:hypothetical protein
MDGRNGKRREAEEILRTLQKSDQQEGEYYFLATIYTAMGDKERALAAVEKMVQERSNGPWSLRDPELDGLRSDTRFKKIMQTVGLE